jgi:SAM-dependent methyltransferase
MRNDGLRGFVARVGKVPQEVIRRWKARPEMKRFIETERNEGFDAKHGTETTSTHRYVARLTTAATAHNATVYWPTSVRQFDVMFDDAMHHPVPSCRVDPMNTTFVDIGCGKGRGLMVAAERGFPQLIGVDFAEEFCDIARRNIGLYEGGTFADRITVVHADVLTWQIPAGPLLVYLFHPFDGVVTAGFAKLLADSLRSSPRRCTVVYLNPVHEDAFLTTGMFQREYRHGDHEDTRYSVLWFTPSQRTQAT